MSTSHMEVLMQKSNDAVFSAILGKGSQVLCGRCPKALRIEHRSHEQAILKQSNLQVGCRTCEMWEGMSGMLSPALLATLITISEGPPDDRKQASMIETHLPELMM